MTVHTPRLLTPEELASLLEVAASAPDVTIPPAHLSRLVTLSYVALAAKGPLVSGDGLIRITKASKQCREHLRGAHAGLPTGLPQAASEP